MRLTEAMESNLGFTKKMSFDLNDASSGLDNVYNSIERYTSFALQILRKSYLAMPEGASELDNVIRTIDARNMMLQQARTYFHAEVYLQYLDSIVIAVAGGQIYGLNSSNEFYSHDMRERLIDILTSIREFLSVLMEGDPYAEHNQPTILPAIPAEKPAPIRIIVENNRLISAVHQNKTGSINYESANRIRESLHETLERLLNELAKNSNTDRRFLKGCEQLLYHLSNPLEKTPIEALGLSYQLVGKMAARVKDEIGTIANDELEHTLLNVGVLLNQFQEWRNFINELAATQIDKSDPIKLVSQTKDLIAEFEKSDAPVDQKIADRFKEMVEPVISGIIEAESVAVPLVASLSNVFAVMSQVAVDAVGVPAVTSGGITLALYSVTILQKFCPILSSMQPFKFIVDVVRFIHKHISTLKDFVNK